MGANLVSPERPADHHEGAPLLVVRDVSIDGDEYDDDAATSDDREMGTMRGRLMTACWLLLLPPEAPLVTPEVALLARISSGLRMRI